MFVGVRDLALIAVTDMNRQHSSVLENDTQRMLNHCMALCYPFQSL